jgi:hypothetical protein
VIKTKGLAVNEAERDAMRAQLGLDVLRERRR